MFENDALFLDSSPKTNLYGSLNYNLYNEDFNVFSDHLYINEDFNSSSLSPSSFECSDDFNDYNEALLTKLIEEFNQEPLPDLNYFNDIFENNNYTDIDNEILLESNKSETHTPIKSSKRKSFTCFNDDFEIITKKSRQSDDKKTCNSDAAFRYRQKQKLNKSKVDEDLDRSALEMVKAKTDMLEMRKKLNTIKNIVKDLLQDKGVYKSLSN